MNSYEKNKMAMFNVIEALAVRYQKIVDAIPALAAIVALFRQSMAEILKRNDEYLGVTEGAVAEKNKALDGLIERVIRIGNAVFTLGRKTGNEQYKAAGDMTLREMNRMREADIEQHCSKISGIVRECAEQLPPYGVTAEIIEAFDKAFDTYKQLVDSKGIKAAESKAARKALHECFDRADDILCNDIDKLMEMVKPMDPDFYRQYKAARAIRDLGGGFSKEKKPVETRETAPLAIAKAA